MEKSSRKKAVAGYIAPTWANWLQKYRVELNAMSTPQFIAWLEGKIKAYDQGKVIPPEGMMTEYLDAKLQADLDRRIGERILRENNHGAQVEAAFREVKQSFSDRQIRLTEIVPAELARRPAPLWKEVVEGVGGEVLRKYPF